MRVTRRQWLLASSGGLAAAASRSLAQEWQDIARATDGTVGAAALHLGSGAMVSMNGDERFPLASVCKLPLAMHALALVDEGKLSLDQQIEVLPRDVWAGVSEIEKHWPGQRTYPLVELIRLAVAYSDNTAEETLFRIGGGGAAMAARLRQWKVDGVRVDRSERQCALDRSGVEHYPPPDQWTDAGLRALFAKVPDTVSYQAMLRELAGPRDTGTPNGTVRLLARLFRGECLSRPSTARLIAILKATTTSPTRLKGLLPKATVVAHKTGSVGMKGFAMATNDSGVIFLPDGAQLAISVYVKASTRDDKTRDLVIGRIARAAWDSWSK